MFVKRNITNQTTFIPNNSLYLHESEEAQICTHCPYAECKSGNCKYFEQKKKELKEKQKSTCKVL